MADSPQRCTDNAFPETLCDCERACYKAGFHSHEEYQGCLDSCSDASDSCHAGCVPDTSSEDGERSDCQDECFLTEADCEGDCNDQEADCEAPCEDILDDTERASCIAECSSARETCFYNCQTDQSQCNSRCQITYLTDTRSEYVDQVTCSAQCCSSDDNNSNRCAADCSSDALGRDIGREIDYLNCITPCLEGADGVIEPSCFSSCSLERSHAEEESGHERDLCGFQCSIDFARDNELCTEATKCHKDCLSDYYDDIELCAFDNEGDNAGLRTCLDSALQDRWDCDTACCFRQHGSDPYTPQLQACKVTQMDCVREILNGCGDPPPICQFDPTAEACLEFAACTDVTDCTDEYKNCQRNIDADAPCNGCLTYLASV